ncbi:Oidioi.mRNA.OKI2018_I69.PAR.g10915.t1.cds [Oikopleura dioica]|uniref:Oidioi.mRNA.OKI2018_I69.PAR.g10915.t1.cds n=1 Tax=Oikopleura dioica TaxID=34765 RepID=A0ABN7RT17_OIKDI|nr:Oidioi.mRNA.OKI2018_I69.PAR.g10915.t1.cds [Oikopleura dioica]
MNRLSVRKFGLTSLLERNDRRRFKYYYNNRFGYKRHWDFRGYYYLDEIDKIVPLDDKAPRSHTIDADWRIRNKWPQMPQGKWEMNEDKKRRLVEYPEIHPALDSRVPQFSFVDGRIPEPPRETQIDAEKNRILVRQIVEMMKELKNEKKSHEENDSSAASFQPKLSQKGERPPPV